MGTRCITEIRSKWETHEKWETHTIIYRHWDGYLDGHGKWLFNFLNEMQIINGVPQNPPAKFANGPGNLSAIMTYQLVKDGHSPSLMSEVIDCGQEYHYRIDIQYGMNGGSIFLTVFDGPMTAFGFGGKNCTHKIFEGTVKQFGDFLKK